MFHLWLSISTDVTREEAHSLTGPYLFSFLIAVATLLLGCLSRHPVVLGDICQDTVDAEAVPQPKDLLAGRAALDPCLCTILAQAHLAEAVATGCGHWVGEYVLAQRAQEVFLSQETDGRGHSLVNTFAMKCQLKNERRIRNERQRNFGQGKSCEAVSDEKFCPRA